jgi:hypothetical protein
MASLNGWKFDAGSVPAQTACSCYAAHARDDLRARH